MVVFGVGCSFVDVVICRRFFSVFRSVFRVFRVFVFVFIFVRVVRVVRFVFSVFFVFRVYLYDVVVFLFGFWVFV